MFYKTNFLNSLCVMMPMGYEDFPFATTKSRFMVGAFTSLTGEVETRNTRNLKTTPLVASTETAYSFASIAIKDEVSDITVHVDGHVESTFIPFYAHTVPAGDGL